MRYAIKTLFAYGWDFIEWDDDGKRTVYRSKKKAEEEIKDLIESTGNPIEEWVVVIYDHTTDDTAFARPPR